MGSCLTSLWMVAVLGQAPAAAPEADWLKAIPAETEVVVRIRNLQSGRDDLVKMVSAMSPKLAPQVQATVNQGVDVFTQQFGTAAATSPILAMARLPQPGDNGPPPFAAILKATDYAAFQKQIVGQGGDVKPRAKAGGYDALTDAVGQPIFTYKGSGFVAVGYGAGSEALVRAIARPGASIDRTLTGDLRGSFLGGDMGVYINLAAIQARYGDQIEQARKQMFENMDKAAGKGAGQFMDAAKAANARMFDAFKSSESLALSFDFAAEGLSLSGLTTVKAGSAAAKGLSRAGTGTGAGLANLPADATFYSYSNVDPDTFEKALLAFLPGAGKSSRGLQEALRLQREAAAREVTRAVTVGKGGVRSISVVSFADPQKAADALTAANNAIKSDRSGASDLIKDIKVEPRAEKYQGFVLDHTLITFDAEKIAQLRPNAPADRAGNPILAGPINMWHGTDGKVFLDVTAPDWDQARAQIDIVLSSGGPRSLGQAAGYQAVRSRLPRQVGTLFMASAQGLLRAAMAQLAQVDPKTKADLVLPKAPALLGGAMTPNARGYQFQFVVPSAVGPVIEQGVLPLLQQANAPNVEQ